MSSARFPAGPRVITMGSIQRMKKYSMASAGLLALGIAVASASCGSNKDTGGLGGGNGSSSSGGDASTCTGFGCSNDNGDSDSGGTGSSSGFTSGDDSGLITVGMTTGVVTHTNCTGGPLSTTQIASLKAGGSAGSLKWLYPYDQTVFPGGISAPTLQWQQSGTPDGLYVHISSQLYDYTGCFKGVNPGQLTIPEVEWATAYAQSK